MARAGAKRSGGLLLAFVALLAIVPEMAAAGALPRGIPRLTELVGSSEDLAIVRTLQLSRPSPPLPGGRLRMSTPVELVRSAGPHGAIPSEGESGHTFNPGEIVVATRSPNGSWRLHSSIAAGGRVWEPGRDFAPDAFVEAAFAIRLAPQESGDARQERLIGMVRADNVLVRGAALDLLRQDDGRLDDRLFAALAAMATCSDPYAGETLTFLDGRENAERMPVLHRLLQCEDASLARSAHRMMREACPINFRRARAPATRRTELAHFDWCWQESDAERRAVELWRILRSGSPLERREAVREVAGYNVLDRERIFLGLEESLRCGDPLTPEVIAQFARFPFERTLFRLRSELFTCDDPTTLRAIHGVLVRHCPLDFDRLYARETRPMEFAQYVACLERKGIREKR